MLVQMHMQNQNNHKETEFALQGEINGDFTITDWLAACREKVKRDEGLFPAGWTPLLCDETSDVFMRATAKDIE